MSTPARRPAGSARPASRAPGSARPASRAPGSATTRTTAASIGSAALAIVSRPVPRRNPARKPVAPVRPPLRVVEPRARRRRAGTLAALCCAATFAVMLGLTFFQAKIAAEQMRLDELQTEIRKEQSRYSGLRLQVAELQSPRSIIGAAEHDGLRPATKVVGYVAPTAADVTAVLTTGAAGPDGSLVPGAAGGVRGSGVGAGR